MLLVDLGNSNLLTEIMTQEQLRIVSLNVNGILNPVKCSKILSKMKKEKAYIAYLQ